MDIEMRGAIFTLIFSLVICIVAFVLYLLDKRMKKIQAEMEAEKRKIYRRGNLIIKEANLWYHVYSNTDKLKLN